MIMIVNIVDIKTKMEKIFQKSKIMIEIIKIIILILMKIII